MSTSVLMASDHENTRREMGRNLHGSEETRPENAKPGGRRTSKSSQLGQKKKLPQRGMGVAQLERLRLQERWKMMTEISPLQSLNLQQQQFLPSSFADPATNAVPIQLPKFGTYGAMNGVGQSSLSQSLLFQRFGNGGFQGPVGTSGVGGAFSDQFQANPYVVGAPNSSFHVGNVIETSKELSSMPNMKSYSHHCAVCRKKKRINGENLGCNGVRDAYAEMSPINGRSSIGPNLRNNRNLSLENQDFCKKAWSYAGCGHNIEQEAEVVAVHRKGSSGGGATSLFMEYEFFPGNGGGSASHMELIKQGSESSSVPAVGGGGASCINAPASTGVDASTSMDLSLKLSY